MDSFPSFHPKINKNVPSKDKKIKNSSKLFRSSLDISGINDNQSELLCQPQSEQDNDEDNYTAARYKVQLEKTKSGALRQKQIPEEIKNTDSTITICIGMPEMFVQKAKMIDEIYKNNNNTNGNNVTEADSLYKINVRNCVKPN